MLDVARNDKVSRPSRGAPLIRLLLGAALCASGAALVGYFLFGLPLAVLLLITVSLAVGTWALVLRRMPAQSRAVLGRRARMGLLAGIPAVAAYDLSRWALIELTGSSVKPFEAWRAFGELLGAGDRAGTAALLVGFCFHLTNGLTFAAAYGVVLAHKGIFAGIAWGLVLEGFMVSFYPGWLGLKALDEFVSVTIFGHVVYGAVLGSLANRQWKRFLSERGTAT